MDFDFISNVSKERVSQLVSCVIVFKILLKKKKSKKTNKKKNLNKNWIYTSCQPHSYLSTIKLCHKQMHISKLFSYEPSPKKSPDFRR